MSSCTVSYCNCYGINKMLIETGLKCSTFFNKTNPHRQQRRGHGGIKKSRFSAKREATSCLTGRLSDRKRRCCFVSAALSSVEVVSIRPVTYTDMSCGHQLFGFKSEILDCEEITCRIFECAVDTVVLQCLAIPVK